MKKNKIIKGLGITLGVIAFIGIAGSIAMGGYVSDRILHQNNMKVYASFDNGERICINRSYKKSFNEYLQRMRRMS